MKPVMTWVLFSILLASAFAIERRQSASVLDANVALADLQASVSLSGSNFELENNADIKVDGTSSTALDFSIAAATQFFPSTPSSSLIVAGLYRELVSSNNGVFLYLYWIANAAKQGLSIEFLQKNGTHTPLDARLTFNPANAATGTVLLDLWSCYDNGCYYTSPSGASWQMATNIAFWAYNSQTIPGSQTTLVNSASAPSWYSQYTKNWASNGIPAGYYAKAGINLKQLPCFANTYCADWNYVAITPYGSSTSLPSVPFTNGYCSHIDIYKSDGTGGRNLTGAIFNLYSPLSGTAASAFKKGTQVGTCTTDTNGHCTIQVTAQSGTFQLWEDHAPYGFIPIAPFTVTVSSFGTMVSYPLRDKSGTTTGLKIQKISGTTGALISGASFLIRQTLLNGTIISFTISNAANTFCTDYLQDLPISFVLDVNGCINVDIIETTAPIGFIPITLLNTSWCIAPNENQQNCTARAVLQIRDQPTPSIQLTKVGNGVLSILGVVLGLTQSSDPNQDLTLIPSYAQCKITKGTYCNISAPTLGTWYVVEITPPTGYMRASIMGPYNIQAGGSYSITVQDSVQLYGAPTVQRLNCYGNQMDQSGAIYQVTSGTNSYTYYGGEGYYQTCFDNGTNVFPMDTNGCADFTITELVPPQGQVPAVTPTKTIHYCTSSAIQSTDCESRTIDVTFESPECTGTVVIQKTGDSLSGGGAITLDGVVFNLVSQSGLNVYNLNTTSANGGVACWTDVPVGYYYVSEVQALAGYVLNTGSQVVRVAPTNDQVINSCDSPSNTLYIYNYLGSGTVKIAKRSDPTYSGYYGTTGGNYLAGATFQISHQSTGWSTTVTTDSTGIICVTVDSLGSFTITEVAAPTGYTISSTVQTISLTTSYTCSNTPYLVTFYDSPATSTPVTYGPSTYAPSTTASGGGSSSGGSGTYAPSTTPSRITYGPSTYAPSTTASGGGSSSGGSGTYAPSTTPSRVTYGPSTYAPSTTASGGGSSSGGSGTYAPSTTPSRLTYGPTYGPSTTASGGGSSSGGSGTYAPSTTPSRVTYGPSTSAPSTTPSRLTYGPSTYAPSTTSSGGGGGSGGSGGGSGGSSGSSGGSGSTCALEVLVYGTRYAGASPTALAGATLQISGVGGYGYGPFTMSSSTACVAVPLGSYTIQESAAPSGYTATTSFPITGTCNTASTCSSYGYGSTQTIYYSSSS